VVVEGVAAEPADEALEFVDAVELLERSDLQPAGDPLDRVQLREAPVPQCRR